jgi:hypothetical protein
LRDVLCGEAGRPPDLIPPEGRRKQ